MKNRLLIILLSCTLILGSCSIEKEPELLEISGAITQIDTRKSYIYIDDTYPVKIDDISRFQVGNRVKVTLIKPYSEDSYNPEKLKVKEIIIME